MKTLFGDDDGTAIATKLAVSFIVPGHPMSFQTTRQGVAKNTGKRWLFDPTEYKAYKEAIQQRAWDAVKRDPHWRLIDAPIQLRIVAIFSRPKKLQHDPRERIPKGTKPDNSNLQKAVEDGCNRIVWTDDARVAINITEKYFGRWLEPESLLVEVKEIE